MCLSRRWTVDTHNPLQVPIIRVVTKISSCQANTKSRRRIKQLGISFLSIFLPFSFESSRGKSPAPISAPVSSSGTHPIFSCLRVDLPHRIRTVGLVFCSSCSCLSYLMFGTNFKCFFKKYPGTPSVKWVRT